MEVDRRSYSRGRTERERDQTSPYDYNSRSRNAKRSYQRDNNVRRRGSCDEPSATVTADKDLRSPCHKQPRFKGQKENARSNKTPVSHRWSKNRLHGDDAPFRQKSPLMLCNNEFPPLGIDVDKFTPEANKDWGSLVEEEELRQSKSEPTKQPMKFKRKLLLTDIKESDKSKENTTSKPPRPMITDPHKLEQRQKQIDIGKNTVAYGRCIAVAPREKRKKEDPWTPDKFQQCSTRSWVGQIKVWRRRLHSFDPPSSSQDDLFSVSSTSSSQATEPDTKMEIDEVQKVSRPTTPDDVFSGFDLDACLIDDGFPL